MRAALLVGLALLGGCSAAREDGRTPLVVFAASSLTEALRDVEAAYEAAHADVDVRLAFAGSQALRLQIESGAAADVFVSANELHMQALLTSGHVATSTVFARNELALILPLENPARIERLEDLERAERVVLGAESVPVGRYARRALEQVSPDFAARVLARVASFEINVRLVRAKVEPGEADAALVYRTDAIAAASRLRPPATPAAARVEVRYPVGVVSEAPPPAEARRFQTFLRGEAGQARLRARGFLGP